ncbi:MAG: hypothetical protein GY737_19695, partial [Desulfobacteraceae bacterium]|nr:hypothetical protein [Desulfobacteraceae bacterium]
MANFEVGRWNSTGLERVKGRVRATECTMGALVERNVRLEGLLARLWQDTKTLEAKHEAMLREVKHCTDATVSHEKRLWHNPVFDQLMKRLSKGEEELAKGKKELEKVKEELTYLKSGAQNQGPPAPELHAPPIQSALRNTPKAPQVKAKQGPVIIQRGIKPAGRLVAEAKEEMPRSGGVIEGKEVGAPVEVAKRRHMPIAERASARISWQPGMTSPAKGEVKGGVKLEKEPKGLFNTSEEGE